MSESHSVVSESLWPHGLHGPWNSPGQNTVVGSLSLLQGIFPTQQLNWGLLHYRQILNQLSYKGSPESEIRSVVSDSLQPLGLYSPWNSPGQNTVVGSLSLLQGIFPTQGLNPGLPHCKWIIYQLNHQGSPRILAWVAYPFSSGSCWPRIWTGVSCIAGRFFTNWAIREAKKRKRGCMPMLPSVFSGSVQLIDFSLHYVFPSLFAYLVIFAWMVNTVNFILLGAE